jgi:hypothetical protein
MKQQTAGQDDLDNYDEMPLLNAFIKVSGMLGKL